MVVKGKTLIGPIFGIFGAGLLLVAAISAFGVQGIHEMTLNVIPMTWEQVGFDPMLLTVSAILTLLWGLFGLIGALLGLVGKRFGVYLMLIFGIIATVGMFVQIGNYAIAGAPYTVFLNSHLFFVDPILLLAGGLIGLFLKD